MHARVATFEGDPSAMEDAIERVRSQVMSGSPPPGLEGARMMMLVDRATGKGVGITLYDSEEAMRRGDEALNSMDRPGGGTRSSVAFYEVPVHTLG